MLVLHDRHIRVRSRGYHAATISSGLALQRTGSLEAHYPPTISFDQVVRSPATRHVTIRPGNAKFLSLLHDRLALRTTQLCRPSPRFSCFAIWNFQPRTRTTESSFPANSSSGRVLVYWYFCGDYSNPGCLRLGCMGHVDSGRCVVCMVASMADWMRATGFIYLLIYNCYSNIV